MLSIEHLTGYDRAVSRNGRIGTGGWTDADGSKFPALAAATRAAGVWNCPTLAIFVRLAAQHSETDRSRIIESRRRFVEALARAGAPLVAGTDAGIGQTAPGESLVDELRELESSGLTRYQALRAATVDAAQLLGLSDAGRIAAGSRADLTLLEANPLDDLRAVSRVSGVVLRGQWIPVRELR